jgi:hypothetical protein
VSKRNPDFWWESDPPEKATPKPEPKVEVKEKPKPKPKATARKK